jgi:hypothetical protein
VSRALPLPLPACGERVGVRGRIRDSERSGCGYAPSPGALRAPTSPRKRGEVQAVPYTMALPFQGEMTEPAARSALLSTRRPKQLDAPF